MSLTSFWKWLHVPANLTIENYEHRVAGLRNLRGGMAYARLLYTPSGGSGQRNPRVIRLIAVASPPRQLDVRIACEHHEDYQPVDELETLRNTIENMLNSKLSDAVSVRVAAIA